MGEKGKANAVVLAGTITFNIRQSISTQDYPRHMAHSLPNTIGRNRQLLHKHSGEVQDDVPVVQSKR